MPLYLGLPQWSHPAWPGQLLGRATRPADHLADYAQVFNAIEGNTTFYATPTPQTIRRWHDATGDHFRFTFKFPQTISHQSDLLDVDREASAFIALLAPLHARLGLLKLQLPAGFGPASLPRLEAFLARLPADFAYAVEVRHPAFFAKGEAERALNRLLMARGVNRIMLDSRPLFSVAASVAAKSAAMIDAQGKKPRLPVHLLATADAPVVRFIGLPHPADNHPFLQPWLPRWRQWLDEGKSLYLFIHTADNAHAPILAREVAQLLGHPLPPFVGENNSVRQGRLDL